MVLSYYADWQLRLLWFTAAMMGNNVLLLLVVAAVHCQSAAPPLGFKPK